MKNSRMVTVAILAWVGLSLFFVSCQDDKSGSGRNHAPDVPSNPHPSNGAINVDADTVYFSWTCEDEDEDVLTHGIVVALDNGWNTLVGFANDLSSPSAYMTGLNYSTTYYWVAWATDGKDTTVSPMWSFTTMAPPTLFSESFEVHTVPGTYWYAADQNSNNGLDYWGDQSMAEGARVYSGSYSAYCADHGDGPGQTYDNNMLAGMQFQNPVNISGYSSVHLSFMMYYDTESGYDYVTLQYWTGSSWVTFDAFTGFAGWTQYSYNLIGFPSQLYLVWVFDSDAAVTDEGAYVDDISLVPNVANSISASRRDVIFTPGAGEVQNHSYQRMERLLSKK